MEKAGSAYADASLFLHGSTIAINTMLERNGAKTAQLITEGFRDIYEIAIGFVIGSVAPKTTLRDTGVAS